MKARRDRALWSLRLILIACATVPAALFAYAAWANYKSAFAVADENIARSLDIATGHTQAAFQSIAVTINSVDQITQARSADSMRREESELNQRLKEMRAAIADIESIWLFDPTGHAIVSSLLIPVPADLDVSTSEFFTSSRDSHAPIFIGQVFAPQATARSVFSVSRKRIDDTGNFVGVIEISIQPSTFESFFAGIARGTTASLALIREDGAILARYPMPTNVGIKLDSTTGFAAQIGRSPEGGRFTTVSAVDHVERRFALRKLAGFPVYVSASLATNDIRHGWLLTMASHLVFGLPATVLLIILVLVAMRRTEAFYAEVERRHTLEANLRQTQKMDAVGQLTGGIAHDFNNLLTIIIGNLQMALKLEHETRVQRMLSNALAGAERAAALTKRLLSFSRRQPLDQAARPAGDRGDQPLVAMHLMDPAERLAVERPHCLVLEIRQPHHSAPLCGSHLAAAFSLLCRPSALPGQSRFTASWMLRILSMGTRVMRSPAISLTRAIGQRGRRPE